MSDPQQLDRELREYLEKEPNLRREDRLIYLKNILHKHLEMTKLDHLITNRDLGDISSNAKAIYTKFVLPLRITSKQIESCELANVAVVESAISYMNKMNLLKKVVKFDY